MTKTSSAAIAEGPRIGAMLRVVSNWVRDQVYAGVVEAGHDDLNPPHLALFRYPGLDGLRPSQLAAELQMTKQAVNVLARHLEECGYITRVSDPEDGRGRIIRLTARGRRVERVVHEHARRAERSIAETLGRRGFDRLREELEKVFRTVTAEGTGGRD